MLLRVMWCRRPIDQMQMLLLLDDFDGQDEQTSLGRTNKVALAIQRY